MIQMEIHGRLGNQMFQYATLRGYMEKYGYKDLKLNFKNGVYSRNFKNDLEQFNIIQYEEVDKIEKSFIQKILIFGITKIESLIDKIGHKDNEYKKNKLELSKRKILIKNGIYFLHQGYMDLEPTNSPNQIFIGNFESAKYFDNIKEKIIEEFTPKFDKLEKNLQLYDKIQKTESVCISIRRGDFLTKENIKGHYVCTNQYFERAIEKIKQKVQNPHFFIFSDDIEWVKNNIKFPEDTDFETGDDPVWEKLRLMYECKHFIISNSTFSRWAQYLSRNDNKIVVAPSRWKNTYQNEDIYEKNWILIEP